MAKICKKTTVWFFTLFKRKCESERKPVVIFMAVMFLLMCLIYSFFLTETISNVVVHQNLEKEIPRVNAVLQEKKFEYITLRNSLAEEGADDLGLVVLDDSSIEYITRDPIGFYGGDYRDNF